MAGAASTAARSSSGATGPVDQAEANRVAQAHAAAYAAGLGATTAAAYWVDRTAAATDRLRQQTITTILALWSTFSDWYDGTAVIRAASQAVELSATARASAASIHAAYVSQVVAAIRSESRVPIARTHAQTYRGGANPWLVQARPAEVYRNQFAMTGDDQAAREKAQRRAVQIAQADIMLAARQAEKDAMDQFDIERYRRIIRPELSRTGSCGLCVVASDRLYKTGDLLPIHGGCNCLVMPVDGHGDPGKDINAEDLQRLYQAAGSSNGRKLRRTRIAYDQHGELGPVLVRRGDRFLDSDAIKLARRQDKIRRQKQLIAGTLVDLQRRSRDGEDLDAAIAYSRDRIDLLDRLAA